VPATAAVPLVSPLPARRATLLRRQPGGHLPADPFGLVADLLQPRQQPEDFVVRRVSTVLHSRKSCKTCAPTGALLGCGAAGDPCGCGHTRAGPRYAGAVHPFFSLGGIVDAGRDALADAAGALRDAFGATATTAS
jgi:hypothetical protein